MMPVTIVHTPFRHAIYRGTNAERLALTSVGVLDEFYETDTGAHYVHNGSYWDILDINVNSTTDLKYRFPKLGFLGASVTNGSGSSNAGTLSYKVLAASAVGILGKCSLSYEHQSFPGSNAKVIVSSGLQNLLNSGIDVLVIGADFGTNDNTLSIADYIVQIHRIVSACKQYSILPVICLTIPQGVAASYVVNRNMAILGRFRLDSSVVIVDCYTPLLDPATGLLNATYNSGDNIHPNDAGHALIGSTIATALIAELPKLPWPIHNAGIGLITNPTMLGATIATSWAFGAGTSVGHVAALENAADSTDLPVGRWAKITLNGALGAGYRQYNSNGIAVVEGDIISIFAYVKYTGTGAVALKLLKQGSTVLTTLRTLSSGASQIIQSNYVVPAGATTLYLSLECTVTGVNVASAYIGAADIFKINDIVI